VRGVLARATRDEVFLDGFELARDAAPWGFPILPIDAPPTSDVAVALADGVAFFTEPGPEHTIRRARRATIDWPREK
jgi:hypothetical protein